MGSIAETEASCHKVSDHLAVTIVGRRPRVIVIILGWIGCEMRQIKSYLDLYHDNGCSTIVAGAPATAIVNNETAVLGEVSIATVREAARLVRMAEMSEMGFGAVPILFHAFGNGGCVVLEEMERRIREVVSEESFGKMRNNSSIRPPLSYSGTTKSMKSILSLSNTLETFSDDEDDGIVFPSVEELALLPRMPSLPRKAPSRKLLSFGECRPSVKTSPKMPVPKLKQPKVHRVDKERVFLYPPTAHDPRHNPEDRAYRFDVSLVTSRLHFGGIIFDSAPCYPTLKSDLKAVEKGISSFSDRLLMQLAIHRNRWKCGNCDSSHTLTISGDQANNRTNQFWNNMQNLSLTTRHAYIYNTNDTICDYEMLEQLVNEQRENGMDIKTRKLTDADSLSDPSLRLNTFSELLEEFLDSVAKRHLQDENSDEGFTSSDEESDTDEYNETQTSTIISSDRDSKNFVDSVEQASGDRDTLDSSGGLLGFLDDDEDTDDFYLTPEKNSFNGDDSDTSSTW